MLAPPYTCKYARVGELGRTVTPLRKLSRFESCYLHMSFIDRETERRQKAKEEIAKWLEDQTVLAEIWSIVEDLISDERSEAYDNGYNDGMVAEREIHFP